MQNAAWTVKQMLAVVVIGARTWLGIGGTALAGQFDVDGDVLEMMFP